MAPDGGAAGPADAELDLVRDTTMGTIPAWTEESRDLARTDSPIRPREDRAGDEEEEERAGQEVFHGWSRSRGAVI